MTRLMRYPLLQWVNLCPSILQNNARTVRASVADRRRPRRHELQTCLLDIMPDNTRTLSSCCIRCFPQRQSTADRLQERWSFVLSANSG